MKTQLYKMRMLLHLALAASLGGCGAGDPDGFDDEGIAEDEELGSLEQAWGTYPTYPKYPTYPTTTTTTNTTNTSGQTLMNCSNPEGTNAAMAAIAVAVARELGRWQTTKDFVIAKTNGITENSIGNIETLKLASGTDLNGLPVGKSRCADGKCANVQALLDMQYDQAKNVYFQGSGSTKVQLNPLALRSRTVAKWKEQEACDKNAKDGDLASCPREEHSLKFVSAAPGSCDMNFTFNVKQKDGTSALRYPGQLEHKLRFADQANPYINFTPLANGDIMIDPTVGLNPDNKTSSTGTCPTICTKISMSDITGQCCACGGINKKFAKAAWSSVTFMCQ